MLDAHLRHTKDALVTPFLARIPGYITPNHLTFLGFIIGLLAPLASCHDRPVLASVAWQVNRLCDGLDGAVARTRGCQSGWGGFIDILCDFTIYSLLPMGIALSPSYASIPSLTALGALLASFHINNVVLFYLSSALTPIATPEKLAATPSAPQRKQLTSLRMMPALIEGTESYVFFSVMLLLPRQFTLLAWCMTTLVVVNVVQRTLVAYHEFEEVERRKRG